MKGAALFLLSLITSRSDSSVLAHMVKCIQQIVKQASNFHPEDDVHSCAVVALAMLVELGDENAVKLCSHSKVARFRGCCSRYLGLSQFVERACDVTQAAGYSLE